MKFAFERAMNELMAEYGRYEEFRSHDEKFASLIRCLSWLEEARQIGRIYRKRATQDMRALD